MRRSNFFIAGLAGFALLAYIRAARFRISSEFTPLYGTKAAVRGLITADPEAKNGRMNFTVRPEGLRQEILITVFSGRDLRYGDSVYIQGKLAAPKPFGDFDYPDYLAAKNIYGEMFLPDVFVLKRGQGSWLVAQSLKLKHYLFARFLAVLPAQPAALLIALISGDKNYLTADNTAAFNNTGLAHLIAVSGYKLTLVLIALDSALPYLGRKKVLVLSAGFSIFYAVMADFAPAVLRACIMSGLFVLAKALGRKYAILPALLVTAALLLWFNPLLIKYDLGFILSFSGILGIIFFAPVFQIILRKLPKKFGLKEVLISSLAAQLATTPLMLYFFHQFSLAAPLANILTVPLLGPGIIAGYFCAFPGLGRLIAWMLGPVLAWMLGVAHFFDQLPLAAINARPSNLILLGIYGAEIAGYWLLRHLLKKRGVFDKLN